MAERIRHGNSHSEACNSTNCPCFIDGMLVVSGHRSRDLPHTTAERCEVGCYVNRQVRCGRFPKGRLANGAPACGIHLHQEKRWGLGRIVMAKTWTEREDSRDPETGWPV